MVPRLLRLIGPERPPVWSVRLYDGPDDPALERDLRAGGDGVLRAAAFAGLSAAVDARNRGWTEALMRRVNEQAGAPEAIDGFEARLARDRLSLEAAEAVLAAVDEVFDGREQHQALSPRPDGARIGWGRARRIAVAAQAALSPELGDVAAGLFEEGRIHARPGRRKAPGALSWPVDGSALVLMSFHGRAADALTLAHEVGHAAHQTLAAGEPSRVLAETAAALSEKAACEQLRLRGCDVSQLEAEAVRLNVEVQARRLRAELAGGPPSADAPFATAAYPFAWLAAQALWRVRADDPERFGQAWTEVLSRSGELACEAALARFGLDARDPGFWRLEAIFAAGLSRGAPSL